MEENWPFTGFSVSDLCAIGISEFGFVTS